MILILMESGFLALLNFIQIKVLKHKAGKVVIVMVNTTDVNKLLCYNNFVV